MAIRQPTVCLALLCKNEEKYIRAALQSAKPFITHWSILDTGSTDGTQDAVRETMVGIPGTLTESNWKGWDKSRTESIDLAKKSGCDFILLLDADETLEGSITPVGFDQVGDVTVHFGDIRYTRPNLLSTKHGWHYVGVTHEYLTAPENPQRVLLPLIVKTAAERAGKTPERCAEDARLLERGLLEEPGNSRYQFYLAQSYKDSLQKEKAIEAYAKRATMGGWDEEVYISLLRVAQLSEGIKTFPEVCDAYKAAQAFRPQRAGETLRNLARYCLWWANGTAYPEGERLFINESSYLPRVKKVEPLKVLVIIPTQNKRPEMLLEAQGSIIAQTRKPDQVVVAGSNDLLHERLNKAIRESSCDAFVVLGDDDLLEPTFIEKTVALMEQSGADIVHTRYSHFGEETCVTGSANHISVTSLCRKSAWAKTEGYAAVPCFDFDFWLSCLESGAKPMFLAEPLWKYRIHPDQAGKNEDVRAGTELVRARHPKIMGFL